MANGSRRSTPVLPSAAAVVSEPQDEPRNTPCAQSKASFTSGMVRGLRPPKIIADSGTPSWFSHSGSITGHWAAGAVNREFGCAPLRPESGVHGFPSQSIPDGGAGTPIPSHQISPSDVSTTLVKMVLREAVAIAFGFVFSEVPGATPKNPRSGFMAYRRPSLPRRIQAMSSPRHVIFQPGNVGCIMARFVLPQALGKAAAM